MTIELSEKPDFAELPKSIISLPLFTICGRKKQHRELKINKMFGYVDITVKGDQLDPDYDFKVFYNLLLMNSYLGLKNKKIEMNMTDFFRCFDSRPENCKRKNWESLGNSIDRIRSQQLTFVFKDVKNEIVGKAYTNLISNCFFDCENRKITIEFNKGFDLLVKADLMTVNIFYKEIDTLESQSAKILWMTHKANSDINEKTGFPFVFNKYLLAKRLGYTDKDLLNKKKAGKIYKLIKDGYEELKSKGLISSYSIVRTSDSPKSKIVGYVINKSQGINVDSYREEKGKRPKKSPDEQKFVTESEINSWQENFLSSEFLNSLFS